MYDSYYRFAGRPFQLTPDPQFYFESGTHRKAMSYLGYGLAQGEGFIVITGDIGAGKTTLVGHLMATIDPQRLTAVKIVSTQVEGDDMLRLAAQAFGIATDHVEKAHLLSRIEAYLHHQARAGRRTLLIVDEAQNLSHSALEELRMLSNFQLGGQSLLQIFLLGQPEFRDRVSASHDLEQLRQRIIATHHLEPMQAQEVGPYIEHRLKVVGWAGNPRFTPGAYALLAQASGCVPRRLNALVSRVLLLGAIDQLDIIDERVVEAVVADMGGDLAGTDLDEEASEAPVVEAEAVGTDHEVEPEIETVEAEFVEAEVVPAFAPQPAFAQVIEAEPVDEVETLDLAEEIARSESVYAAEPAVARVIQQAQEDRADVERLRALHSEVETLNAALAGGESVREGDETLSGKAAERVAELELRLVRAEMRLDEQDEVLRRILSKLIEWVERDARNGPFTSRVA